MARATAASNGYAAPLATAARKADHLRINLEEDVAAKGVTTGLERYRLRHQALPELDLAAVDLSLTLFGRRLRAPLLISSMTGGVAAGGRINRTLATVAQTLGLGMGVGSQRAALEAPERSATFQVREVAPNILLFANLGAIQLNYGYGSAECQRAVEMIGADALVLHLNPLQEAVQAGGDTNFGGLAQRIAQVCRALPVPVVVKEVGWGISTETARLLVEAGVAAIDVAGAGGTSWSEVEKHRAADPAARRLATAFAGWGLPTADSLLAVRAVAPHLPLIASGGVRTGIEATTALALGATAVAVASPALRAAARSTAAVTAALQAIIDELRVAMFCTGAGTLAALGDGTRVERR